MVSGLAVGREGHSLPELLVAVAFLGATLGVVGSSAVLGARQVAYAALRHEAVREAAAVLDSVAADSAAAAGSRTTARLRVYWALLPRPGGPGVRVTVVSRGDGRPLATLTGAALPVLDTLPSLPASGAAAVP